MLFAVFFAKLWYRGQQILIFGLKWFFKTWCGYTKPSKIQTTAPKRELKTIWKTALVVLIFELVDFSAWFGHLLFPPTILSFIILSVFIIYHMCALVRSSSSVITFILPSLSHIYANALSTNEPWDDSYTVNHHTDGGGRAEKTHHLLPPEWWTSLHQLVTPSIIQPFCKNHFL